MITISLDEAGVFENNLNATGTVMMIAGIVYDDKGDLDDVKREKSRIRNYFETICSEENAQYPQALHWGSAPNNAVIRVKNGYMKTLNEFLKDGTHNGQYISSHDGKTRTGVYYVYCMAKSRKGKPELIKTEVSNLVNESNASNLYMHMVEDVISRLLFYNMDFIDQKEVSLDLATRVYVTEDGVDISSHTDIGYSSRTATKNGKINQIVKLTNKDVFRTALARDMLIEEKENDIQVKSLQVRSIDYYHDNVGHEFLYMADAICTWLSDDTTYGTRKEYLKKIWKGMEQLADDRRLLFSHDIVDSYFVKAWRNVENGDIYNAFDSAYKAFNVDTEAAIFYKEIWEPVLYKRIIDTVKAENLVEGIRKLVQYSKSNNLNQEKLLYIFKSIKLIIDKSGLDNQQTKAVLYEFYGVGISAYNHVGKANKALECVEKCEQYKRYISMELEILNRNKKAVSLCDSFKYKEAEELVLPSLEYYKNVIEMQQKLFGQDCIHNSMEYAIVCSQLGQIYSYMCDEKAEALFHAALAMLEKDSIDYYRTQSYLLHYYLQTKNQEKYEKYALEYFGNFADLEKQFTYVIKEGSKIHNPKISMKFALFIYLKGIVTFYVSELTNDLVLKLADIEKAIVQIEPAAKSQIKGHPWEIMYKYLAIIAFQNKRYTEAANYKTKLEGYSDDKGLIIDLIMEIGKIEITKIRSPLVDVSENIQKVCELLMKINPEIEMKEKTLEEIYQIVTYTYV